MRQQVSQGGCVIQPNIQACLQVGTLDSNKEFLEVLWFPLTTEKGYTSDVFSDSVEKLQQTNKRKGLSPRVVPKVGAVTPHTPIGTPGEHDDQ